MDLDTAGLARMRLGEHAIHTWDIAMALDPAATVAPDAVGLLIDALGQLVARTAKPGGPARRWQVSTTTPGRHFTLATGETVTLAVAATRACPGWAGVMVPLVQLIGRAAGGGAL